jgi:shikimate dehydrogenase
MSNWIARERVPEPCTIGGHIMPDKELNFLSRLTGSFSVGAASNPTVAMIEAAYRHHGLDWRYINCEVEPERLGDAVRGARAMGWAGFNCSLPHKVAVIKHLDGLGESASIMGAVNCVVRRGDRYLGENTDGKGFLMSLEGVVDPRGKRIVLFGAGGAARAVAVELALAGARSISVINRNVERGTNLVEVINGKTAVPAELIVWDRTCAVQPDADIVINCTSIGLYPQIDARLDIHFASLKPGMVVADVIPNPPRTNLIKDAEARGCTIIDGLGMLVNQGVISIKYWTGADVDATIMRQKLEDIFGG